MGVQFISMEAITSGNENLKKTLIVFGIIFMIILAFFVILLISKQISESIFEGERKELNPIILALGDEIFFNFTSQEERVNTLITNRSVIISKWDRNFSFNFPDFVNVIPIENGVIINHSNRRQSILRMTDNNTFEWDFVLFQRPILSFVIFPIGRNIECYYQPPLTQENFSLFPEVIGINETDAWDENGTIIAHRPINVVGSYACYGNRMNNEYKTGKIFHIYRPFVYDANNNSIWGQINITSNNILILSVNRTWLDNAVYPVNIDPTFGYTSIGASISSSQNAWAHRVTNSTLMYNATAGDVVTNISIYAKTSAGLNNNHRLAIYNITEPVTMNRKIGNSSFFSLSTTASWHTTNVNIPLVGGVRHFIAVGDSGRTRDNYYDTGLVQSLSSTGDTPLPVTWSEGGSGTQVLSMYATYTIAGGGDTCTYSGTGKWNVSCTDNCVITSIYNLGSNDLQLYGSGTFTLKNKLIVDDIIRSPSCTFVGINNTVIKP